MNNQDKIGAKQTEIQLLICPIQTNNQKMYCFIAGPVSKADVAAIAKITKEMHDKFSHFIFQEQGTILIAGKRRHGTIPSFTQAWNIWTPCTIQ